MPSEDALTQAQENYRKVLEMNPGYAPAYFRLGYIYEQKASYDQAIDFYQQGLNINPTNIFAHFRLGKIHLLMGMLELAVTRFKEIVDLSRNRTHDIYQEGYLFNKLRFFKEANALGAWIELGKIYVKRRQYDEAFEAFQKALEIDRSSPLAIMNQIDLYKIRSADSKDTDTLYSRYIEQYKNAAMVDFQNPVAHFALAYACQILPSILPEKQEERLEEALNSYQMAINLTPDFKWAYWGLKDSYLTVVEGATPLFEQALDACKLVTELDPEDPRAYYETGDVYRRMGQLQQAFEYFEKAVEKDKTYIPAYLNMAEIRSEKRPEKQSDFTRKLSASTRTLRRVIMNSGASTKISTRMKRHLPICARQSNSISTIPKLTSPLARSASPTARTKLHASASAEWSNWHRHTIRPTTISA